MAGIHGPAALRFLAVLAFTVVWLGLVYSVPDVGAVTNRVGVFRIAIHLVILAGLWFALERTMFEPDVRLRVWLLIAIPLTLWLAGIWTLAVQGAFIPAPEISRVPALPIAILLPPLIALFLLLRSKRVAVLLDATPAAWLVGLQVYRVLGGIFLVNWARGLMPREFALPAGSGDVLVGLLALPAALYVASGTRTGRRIGIAWNVLGLLDFTVAIGMGMMTAPGPLQVIVPERANSLVGTYPTVMIPAFSVPSGIVLHVLSIWQLVRLGRRAHATTAAPMPTLQPTR
jgi:hypothetical protein